MRPSLFYRGMLLCTAFVLGCVLTCSAYVERNLLTGKYTLDDVKKALAQDDSFMPIPSLDDPFWANLPEQLKNVYLENGEKLLGTSWGELPATLYMEYRRNGNRNRYEAVSFARRNMLNDLVMAECVERKGRFLDDIINGIWAICEESYWGIPAHNIQMERMRPITGLPNVEDRTIDLFAAETSALLAFTCYMLADRLDAVEPKVTERVHYEMEERIFKPAIEKNFHWSGLGNSKKLNNWTPWINSNLLFSSLLMDDNAERRAELVYKTMIGVDIFVNGYYDDGACDEGPSYWNRAGASLLEYLECLSLATDGKIDIFDNRLVHDMGRYIFKGQIKDNLYVNFADAGPRVNVNAPIIYRYGVYTNDDDLKGFAAQVAKLQGLEDKGYGDALGRRLFALLHHRDLMATPPAQPAQLDYWMDGVQVMTARSTLDPSDCLFVAAKGGHNAESHNHNDVGNFMVCYDGVPMLIDIGSDTYTAKTFGPHRYELFNNQSQWHNLPTINGCMQSPGAAFRGTDASFKANDKTASMKVDIAKAYPEEAKVKSWVREVTLARNKEVTIRDNYQLEAVTEPFVLNLVTGGTIEQSAPGVLTIAMTYFGDTRKMTVNYDPKQFDVSLDEQTEFDSGIRNNWFGQPIRRIKLRDKSNALKGNYTIRIKPVR